MYPALTFEQRFPNYQKGWWDKRREPSFLEKFARALPTLNLLPNQHRRIMDGSLLRGIRKQVEAAVKPAPELSKRELKILRRLAAGDYISRTLADKSRLLSTDGKRRCKIRHSDVMSLERRGLVGSNENFSWALTTYGRNALARVV